MRVRSSLPQVPDRIWDGISRQYRRGLWWGHDAAACSKYIVAALQRYLTDTDTSVFVALDESADPEEMPAGVIVAVGDVTRVIPMEFRLRRVRVGDTDVFVSHDGGAAALARAMVAEAAKALDQN